MRLSPNIEVTVSVLVQNHLGTAHEACPSGTWLDHWRRHLRKHGRPRCSNLLCPKDATRGGLVKWVGRDPTPYVVPLCDDCISLLEPFIVMDDVLVPTTAGLGLPIPDGQALR